MTGRGVSGAGECGDLSTRYLMIGIFHRIKVKSTAARYTAKGKRNGHNGARKGNRFSSLHRTPVSVYIMSRWLTYTPRVNFAKAGSGVERHKSGFARANKKTPSDNRMPPRYWYR